MSVFRIKHTFTAGELSPLLDARVDFDRFKNGCKKLLNMVCTTQGPATRRSGFKFIYDFNDLDIDYTQPVFRAVPFVFNEVQAYAMFFFMSTGAHGGSAGPRIVLGYGQSDPANDGLVVYGNPVPASAPAWKSPGDVVEIILPTTFDIESFDWAQSADDLFIGQSGHEPMKISRADHDDWSYTNLLSSMTAAPSDWTVVYGYPEKVTFHQQRLIWAANLLKRQTVWASVAGDFLDYTPTPVTTASQAITFTLDSGTQNRIQWLMSVKSLNIGTLANEWTVVGSPTAWITPESVYAQRHTNNGSESIKPLMVGLTTLFVERHGRTINEFVYDYTFDSYKTSDLSILAPHLTELYSITDWTYQQTPDSIIWCVREDGKLLGLTYQRQHKVIGWHVHDTEGEFKVITGVPGNTREDDIWAIVKRTVNTNTRYYIEKMADRFSGTTAQEGRFLDSYAYIDNSVAQLTTLTGLLHLANTEVDILADGTVHPPTTVTVGGELTLNDVYDYIVVGLPYYSEVRPMLPDLQLQDGTALGRSQRIVDVYIDLFRSLGMYLGRTSSEDATDYDHEEEVPFRVAADLMGQAVPLYTGIRRLSFPEGFDSKAEYYIRQKQPLPLTVRGVVDNVEVFD